MLFIFHVDVHIYMENAHKSVSNFVQLRRACDTGTMADAPILQCLNLQRYIVDTLE